MKTTNTLWQRLGQFSLLLGASLASQAALAVNDLPGGPAVRQIDRHPPVTKIATEQQWLHNFMLIVGVVIFIAVFSVMFYAIFKNVKSAAPNAPDFNHG